VEGEEKRIKTKKLYYQDRIFQLKIKDYIGISWSHWSCCIICSWYQERNPVRLVVKLVVKFSAWVVKWNTSKTVILLCKSYWTFSYFSSSLSLSGLGSISLNTKVIIMRLPKLAQSKAHQRVAFSRNLAALVKKILSLRLQIDNLSIVMSFSPILIFAAEGAVEAGTAFT